MKIRNVMSLVLAAAAGIGGTTYSPDAEAALVSATCTVTLVGWREPLKALRTECGGLVFFNLEQAANPSCLHKTPMDAVKMFQTTANASMLSGRPVKIWYDRQSGCGAADPVIREMYLL